MDFSLYLADSAATNILTRLPLDTVLDTLLDGGYLPTPVIRAGIRAQLRQRINMIRATSNASAYETKMKYVELLRSRLIAVETGKANEQHYEVGTGVLSACLGPRMKYSCCLYEDGKGRDLVGWGKDALGKAEVRMMEDYVVKAGLVDGMKIFDLGWVFVLLHLPLSVLCEGYDCAIALWWPSYGYLFC